MKRVDLIKGDAAKEIKSMKQFCDELIDKYTKENMKLRQKYEQMRAFQHIEIANKDAITDRLTDIIFEYAYQLKKLRAIIRTPRLMEQLKKAKDDYEAKQHLWKMMLGKG